MIQIVPVKIIADVTPQDKLDEIIHEAFEDKAGSAIYNSGFGERYVSATPVFYNNEQVMTIAVSSQMNILNRQVDEVLTASKIQIFVLFGFAATAVMVIFLLRWNKTLDNKIKQRTLELRVKRSINSVKCNVV